MVYDIQCPDTFSRAQAWVKELRQQANQDIVIALAGNKADLAAKREVETEVISSFEALCISCFLIPPRRLADKDSETKLKTRNKVFSALIAVFLRMNSYLVTFSKRVNFMFYKLKQGFMKITVILTRASLDGFTKSIIILKSPYTIIISVK